MKKLAFGLLFIFPILIAFLGRFWFSFLLFYRVIFMLTVGIDFRFFSILMIELGYNCNQATLIYKWLETAGKLGNDLSELTVSSIIGAFPVFKIDDITFDGMLDHEIARSILGHNRFEILSFKNGSLLVCDIGWLEETLMTKLILV